MTHSKELEGIDIFLWFLRVYDSTVHKNSVDSMNSMFETTCNQLSKLKGMFLKEFDHNCYLDISKLILGTKVINFWRLFLPLRSRCHGILISVDP